MEWIVIFAKMNIKTVMVNAITAFKSSVKNATKKVTVFNAKKVLASTQITLVLHVKSIIAKTVHNNYLSALSANPPISIIKPKKSADRIVL